MPDPNDSVSTILVSDVGKTYSAAKVLLCMRRRSTSLVLWTRKALWPEGIR